MPGVSRRRLLAVTATIVGLLLSAALGSIGGYLIGYRDALGRNAPADAVYTVGMLNSLRSGNTALTAEGLETQLDGILMERWLYDHSSHLLTRTIFWPGEISPVSGQLMASAADYRMQHPTQAHDTGVKAAIAEVVARYSRAE